MSDEPFFTGIVLAAGRGERAGLGRPKQFMTLAGKPLLRWSVDAMLAHPRNRGVVVVGDPAADDALAGISVRRVAGGAQRHDSVRAGLAALDDGDDLLLVHDAARPGLDAGVIDRLLAALADPAIAGAVPVLPVADTLARRGDDLGDTVDRSALVRVQTPQAFRAAALRAAHGAWAGPPPTDDAQMLRAAGGRVAMVAGSPRLEKLTYAEDIAMLERMLAGPRRVAMGTGFDVHRLVPGDGLWLGGVRIAHDRALLGHSDADVALHAITDALLGALGDGDIGSHFPPSDPRWRGAASDRFLAHARDLVAARGGRIDHVDCTIICESPRIGPHRPAMRARIAGILALPLPRVSVKATTSEGLGFAGRGEGIAAQAAATLCLPMDDERHHDERHDDE